MQVEVFMPVSMEDRSDAVISVKDENVWLEGGGEAGSGKVWKCDRKDAHLLTVKELEMVSMGLRSLVMVENRVLGLLLLDCMTEE